MKMPVEQSSHSNLQVFQLNEIAGNAPLREERNFAQRAEAIDFIEFELIATVEYQLLNTEQKYELISLKESAEKVKSELEAVDAMLFQRLRAKIRSGLYSGKEFTKLVKQYVNFDLTDGKHMAEPGYDNLDIFMNGLTHPGAMPNQTLALEPEMVYYQKTPARIIFELAERLDFTSNDVFFDLGSGMGQVAILINLLTCVKAKGIEFEPAFCKYAATCAAELNLSGISFVNTDARDADYSEGSVFFMFTPFRGEIMHGVLDRLRRESLKRKITIITYGPCTAEVATQSWLFAADAETIHDYKLTVFGSLQVN